MAKNDSNTTPRNNSTIAPSEKHLEDWIVANQEKCVYTFDGINNHSFIGDIIVRQPRLPSGIPDLLMSTPYGGSVYVIELKKRAIDHHTIAQAMRYMDDLAKIAARTEKQLYDLHGYDLPQRPSFETMGGISAILIGSRVEDDDVLRICHYNNIFTLTYTYENPDYVFHPQWISLPPPVHIKPYGTEQHEEWSQGVIGDYFLAQFGLKRDELL